MLVVHFGYAHPFIDFELDPGSKETPPKTEFVQATLGSWVRVPPKWICKVLGLKFWPKANEKMTIFRPLWTGHTSESLIIFPPVVKHGLELSAQTTIYMGSPTAMFDDPEGTHLKQAASATIGGTTSSLSTSKRNLFFQPAKYFSSLLRRIITFWWVNHPTVWMFHSNLKKKRTVKST